MPANTQSLILLIFVSLAPPFLKLFKSFAFTFSTLLLLRLGILLTMGICHPQVSSCKMTVMQHLSRSPCLLSGLKLQHVAKQIFRQLFVLQLQVLPPEQKLNLLQLALSEIMVTSLRTPSTCIVSVDL
jgi:hypothetical protein